MVFFMSGLFAAIGGFVQAVSGFGSGVVLMIILPEYFNMLMAPALSVSICLAVNAAMTWRYRKSIEWKKILVTGSCYILCSLFAIRIAGKMNLTYLHIAFGIFLILLAVYFFFFSKKAGLKGNLINGLVCSSISGICAGFFGIGGPLMGLYYVQVTSKRETYLADLSIIFTANSIISMTSRIVRGYYTINLLPYTAYGMILVILGMKLGGKLTDKIDVATFKKIVYIVVALSGVLTLTEELL